MHICYQILHENIPISSKIITSWNANEISLFRSLCAPNGGGKFQNKSVETFSEKLTVTLRLRNTIIKFD